MNDQNWHVEIRRAYHDTEVQVRIGGWSPDGRYLTVILPAELKQFTREDLDSGKDQIPPPVLTLHREAAESLLPALMDALWEAGYRPKDIGTAGHLAATQAHLEDMRRLVFREFGVDKPSPEN